MRSFLSIAMLVLLTGLGFGGWVMMQTTELRADRDYEFERAAKCKALARKLLASRKTHEQKDADYVVETPPVFISFINSVARSCAIPSTAMTVDRDLPRAAPRLNSYVRDVTTRISLRKVSVKQLVAFFGQIQEGRPYLQLRELTLRQTERGSGTWEATGVLSYFLWDEKGGTTPSRTGKGVIS